MPPRITRVRWSAQGLPWGVQFNERTGTFSGTPEDAGEYTVPVTVETNYGTDTKDVKIVVEAPAYTVYSIGEKAATWANGANADEYGFYPLITALKMAKLYEWTGGFAARNYANSLGLGCGVNYLYIPNWQTGNLAAYDNKPNINSGDLIPDYPASPLYTKCVLTATAVQTDPLGCKHKIYCIPRITKDGDLSLKRSGSYGTYIFDEVYDENAGTTSHYNGFLVKDADGNFIDMQLPVSQLVALPYIDGGNTIGWLSEDGATYGLIECDSYIGQAFSSGNITAYTLTCKISTVDIGYNAKKMFNTLLLPDADFHFLSEDGFLDNDPDNFVYGVIKDAWVNGRKAYVQTSTNRLYEYNATSKTWGYIGTFDVKKLLFLNDEVSGNFNDDFVFSDDVPVLLLTNDGSLYHKGNEIPDVSAAHTTLTRIFPTLTFKDFTFGGNTLTVLRE